MTDGARITRDGGGKPRLQKILASAGYGSRRQCEQLIVDGRVEVDRKVANELGVRVDPATQHVRVDGVVLKLPRHKYFMLHKPVGVISTSSDPWARTRVIDLVADTDRLFTVGRLDKSSSGLILVTNDGDLAFRLTHPKFRVDKVYRVLVAGCPTADTLQQLRTGVYLAEGKAKVEHVVVKKTQSTQSELEIVLSEGRNREIRRLLARFGHKVQQLKRLSIGPVRLGDLPVGAYRELTRQEVQLLRQSAVGQAAQRTEAGATKGRAKGAPRRPVRGLSVGKKKPRIVSPVVGATGPVTGRPTVTRGRTPMAAGRRGAEAERTRTDSGRSRSETGRSPATTGRSRAETPRDFAVANTGRPIRSGAGRSGTGRSETAVERPAKATGRPKGASGRPERRTGRPGMVASRSAAARDEREPRRVAKRPNSLGAAQARFGTVLGDDAVELDRVDSAVPAESVDLSTPRRAKRTRRQAPKRDGKTIGKRVVRTRARRPSGPKRPQKSRRRGAAT